MMPGLLGSVGGEIITARPYRSFGVALTATVPAGATAHTKGSWVQLVASTSADANGLGIYVYNIGGASVNSAALFDVGIGASGSEVVVASNIAVGGAAGTNFIIPITIPAGSRIALRHQNATANRTSTVICDLLADGPLARPPATVTTVGGNTSTSLGMAVSGGSAWTTMVASTPEDYQAVTAVWSTGGVTSITALVGHAYLAYGAAGSEQVRCSFRVITTTGETCVSDPGFSWNAGPCPAGTTIRGTKPTTQTWMYGTLICVPYA